MPVRGIRGAVTVENDRPEEILAATGRLLSAIIETNPGLCPEDVASVLLTVTDDLRSIYPARAARELGWTEVPLLCAQEIPVAGSLPRCIRVLLHWNTTILQREIHHVYLGEAAGLRPDLAEKNNRQTKDEE